MTSVRIDYNLINYQDTFSGTNLVPFIKKFTIIIFSYIFGQTLDNLLKFLKVFSKRRLGQKRGIEDQHVHDDNQNNSYVQ